MNPFEQRAGELAKLRDLAGDTTIREDESDRFLDMLDRLESHQQIALTPAQLEYVTRRWTELGYAPPVPASAFPRGREVEILTHVPDAFKKPLKRPGS